MEQNEELKKELGLFMATALVVGNMMGSGIFMLPATLAQKSGPGATMMAWGITGIGSIFLALSFANLGSIIPKTGGPYEFSKVAFGDFVGFMNAWLYWNGCWIGNAAIIIAVASYVGFLFPVVATNPMLGFICTSSILWIFTLLNIKGVKLAARVQTASTIIKIALFIFFVIIAGLNFNIVNITPLFPEGKGLETVPAAATATLWAFTGLETAAVTGGEIKNGEKNIKRSTIIGMIISTIFYMLISFAAMGAMSQNSLITSNAPLVDIFSRYLGSGAGIYIGIFALLSLVGTTIGWLLSTARVSYAAGVDGVFPHVFSKIHPKYKTPYASLIISGVLVNILLLMNFTKGFGSAFTFVSLLATLSYLPIYALATAAEILLVVKHKKKINILNFIKSSIVPLMGFIYALWTIYGSGAETVMYGFLLLLSGIPFYLYMNIKNRSIKTEVKKENLNNLDMPI
ncbi:amino acid permease [Clostridium sp. MSJ-4]|uniref:Amino acid permease n=1 Tax=Clostridium simiarum TaxID=2841506 RepID=A0ABS6F2Z0_9CLOT|nr:amino acid permease [Clostridium simiarum]MBU5592866.1 amino acid permease [Clostridium simiarum]